MCSPDLAGRTWTSGVSPPYEADPPLYLTPTVFGITPQTGKSIASGPIAVMWLKA